jgi:hypothetical protein
MVFLKYQTSYTHYSRGIRIPNWEENCKTSTMTEPKEGGEITQKSHNSYYKDVIWWL